MIYALLFVLVVCFGYLLAVWKGPFWGLLAYTVVYFNPPFEHLNWWGAFLPPIRWSLISSAVLVISMVIHWNKLSDHKLASLKWAISFTVLTAVISVSWAIEKEDAYHHTYVLVTFLIAAYCITKAIRNVNQFRLFLLVVVVMAANLSLNAYRFGKRINARLENIGTADSIGANEFALLLAAIIPLVIPFLLSGKRYEKVICILALPFLLNAYILCNSRSGLVAVAVSLFAGGIFVADNKIRKKMLLGSILFVPFFFYLADQEYIDRISTLININKAVGDQSEAEELSSGRTAIWSYSFDMVSDHPMGAGPNAYKHLARFYMPPELLAFHTGDEYGTRSAHNSYLEVLVEQGYLGFFLWLLMCFHTLYLLFTSSRKLKKITLKNQYWMLTIFALTLSFTSILFGSMFNSRIYYEFFWWQIALVVKASAFVREEALHFEEEGETVAAV